MLEFVLKAVHITPWEYDVESQTVNISDNFLQQSNLSQNSVALDEILKYMYPSDAQLLIQGLSNLIEETCSLMVIQIRSKEPGMEDYQWFEMQAVAYQRYEDRRVRSIIGLKHDITDLKHTEELVRLREKAEESNRLKSTFLANMSHDIRTPLNAIVGFSTLMAETDDKEERQEFAQIIEANNDMLLHLINDILDMSKIEAGQMEFIYSEVNLNDLIQNLGYTFRFKIKKEVYMSLDIPSEPYILYTEKNRLTQVLSNFISNACKYTFEGSITVGYEIEGKQIYFYVRDTGKGIEKENLPHVFERFAKFDTFVKGTGLGLSICELIIQTLGGEIGVESEVGKGSTFWFTLPISERVES
ncbi:HAMP domain-containing histidine kinase [Parabacteroides acidifaciens]|uniref:histidine kinase n=2 Tax=Parabacteroides acidifaciens TaxID=2290935 RepID=A0A3D8HCJ6_9BACT|nr:HAMP domain-containing histidine kinase [Parabacteroides acidifaciens]RDU48470.1 sensor histidine kinase [Parabacteroides acidifaciens]